MEKNPESEKENITMLSTPSLSTNCWASQSTKRSSLFALKSFPFLVPLMAKSHKGAPDREPKLAAMMDALPESDKPDLSAATETSWRRHENFLNDYDPQCKRNETLKRGPLSSLIRTALDAAGRFESM